MINLDLTQTELDELYEALSSNQRPSARNKCLVVYLRAKGYPREAVADIARVDPDSVTHYAKQYVEGGLGNLLKNNYRRCDSGKPRTGVGRGVNRSPE